MKSILVVVILLLGLSAITPTHVLAQQYGQQQVLGTQEPRRIHRVVSSDIGDLDLVSLGSLFLATSAILYFISLKLKTYKKSLNDGGDLNV